MIIFDLDGTLADCEHRRHFIDWNKTDYSIPYDQWKPDWKSFFEACDKDKPIIPVCDLLRDLSPEYEYEIWSGRCESVRDKTEVWIQDWLHCSFNSNKLKMRPIGNTEPDDQLKQMWLHETIAEGKTIDFVFDDRPKVIRMWRRHGIFVFNCCQHDEEF